MSGMLRGIGRSDGQGAGSKGPSWRNVGAGGRGRTGEARALATGGRAGGTWARQREQQQAARGRRWQATERSRPRRGRISGTCLKTRKAGGRGCDRGQQTGLRPRAADGGCDRNLLPRGRTSRGHGAGRPGRNRTKTARPARLRGFFVSAFPFLDSNGAGRRCQRAGE